MGVIVWFTGLPASGKTTLARRVQASLSPRPLLLDSDEVRDIFDIRGYEALDRDRFYARLASLAQLVAAQGVVVLVAATAPSRAHRDRARASGLPFVEVWVRTSLAESERRDRKGLYAAARRGDAPALPGIGVSYEPPVNPEVVADGGHDETAVTAILAAIANAR